MIRTAVKFAIFGAVCLALTLWLAFVIGNREFGDPLNRDNFTLTAAFDDVTGLLVNDEVKIAGVEVGKVTGITTEAGRAVVSFQVRNDYRDALPVDTSASIRWRNLIGQRFLYLVPGQASTMLEPDDEVCGDESVCTNDSVADLGALFNRLGPIVSAIDEGQVNDFLETFTQALEGNTDRLGQTLADLGTLTEGLAGRDAAISSLLEDLNTVAGTLTARDQQIRTLLDNLVVLAQTFSDNTDVVDRSLAEFASFSTDLSTLLETNAAQIDAIIANLDSVVDTEVITRLEGLRGALDGLDEASRAVFNAGRNGEWLNQDILCAATSPPPCPTPVNLVDSVINSSAVGTSAPDPQTGTSNLVTMLTEALAGPR
jgi:phospholipid/cholesterol/gamma-HCH transport system substrate-binding protein